MLPPTILFVGFTLILWTKRPILEEHGGDFSGFFTFLSAPRAGRHRAPARSATRREVSTRLDHTRFCAIRPLRPRPQRLAAASSAVGTSQSSRSEPWKRSRRSARGSDSGRWTPRMPKAGSHHLRRSLFAPARSLLGQLLPFERGGDHSGLRVENGTLSREDLRGYLGGIVPFASAGNNVHARGRVLRGSVEHQRQSQRRQIRPQADAHPAPATGGPRTPRRRRDTAKRCPQLQRQSGDDFTACKVAIAPLAATRETDQDREKRGTTKGREIRRYAHPPQCADAPLLTIIATILFCDSAFSSAVDTNGRRSPVQRNCTRFSGTLLV